MKQESELKTHWGNSITVFEAMQFGANLDTTNNTMWYQGHTYKISEETVLEIKQRHETRHYREGKWIVKKQYKESFA